MKRNLQTAFQALLLVTICVVLLSQNAKRKQELYSAFTQPDQQSPSSSAVPSQTFDEPALQSSSQSSQTLAVSTESSSTSSDFRYHLPTRIPVGEETGHEEDGKVAAGIEDSLVLEGSAKQEALSESPTTPANVTVEPPPLPEKEIEIIPGMKTGKENLTVKAFAYTDSIMDPNNTEIKRLECRPPQTDRYDYLKWQNTSSTAEYEKGRVKARYLVALDLYRCVDLLPRLMGTVVELANWVGPENVVVSVVEGRSDDGTYEVLAVLSRAFANIGVRYHLATNEVNPVGGEGVDRIQALSDLRNQALLPLIENPASFSDDDPVIIFINDVAVCLEDLLELIHQQVSQSMDMACAMDWIYDGNLFYDVWVTRSILGQIFFEIPQDGTWGFSGNLLFDDPVSRIRRDARVPFQVYACWNGVSIIRAKPFLDESKPLRFRRSDAKSKECMMGEPTLLCKDLWRKGHNRIAVVPSVNVGYDDQASWDAKNRQGTVNRSLEIAKQAEQGWIGHGLTGAMTGDFSGWVLDEEQGEPVNETVNWQVDPPALVKCLPDFTHVSWVPPLWP